MKSCSNPFALSALSALTKTQNAQSAESATYLLLLHTPMNNYQYTLQPYGNGRNTRFDCPNCNKKKQFTRYIDAETGEFLHETVGICNRINKCSYHYTPKEYFADSPWQATGLQPKSNRFATLIAMVKHQKSAPKQTFSNQRLHWATACFLYPSGAIQEKPQELWGKQLCNLPPEQFWERYSRKAHYAVSHRNLQKVAGCNGFLADQPRGKCTHGQDHALQCCERKTDKEPLRPY